MCLEGPSIVNFFDRRCVYYGSYDEDGRIADGKSTFLVLMLVLIRMSQMAECLSFQFAIASSLLGGVKVFLCMGMGD